MPLSPTPQPAPPVNGASSRESVAETPNGDLGPEHRADVSAPATLVDADAASQGVEAVEHAPPTPAKDDAEEGSLTLTPNPAAVDASKA